MNTTRLGRLARWSYRRRRMVLAAWLFGLIAVSAVSGVIGGKFENKFGSGSSGSAQASTLLNSRFPARSGDNAEVVFHRASGAVTDRDVAPVAAAVGGLAHVVGVDDPFADKGAGQISADHSVAVLSVQFDKPSYALPKAAIQAVIDKASGFRTASLEIEFGGSPVDAVEFASPGASEGIGIGAAIIILLLAFGSLIAMGLPILVAMFGIGAGVGMVDLISRLVTVPSFGTELAAMIGIGVGIDYALFIVTRYRQGLHEGLEPEDTVVHALTTAGRAVLFAGCTVVISLLGMLLLGVSFVVGLAFGAIAAVVLVLLASMTLLPAMLGFAGRSIDRFGIARLLHTHDSTKETFWHRWGRLVQRVPWIAALVSLVVLVALALPLFSMRLAFTDDSNNPSNLTTRKAYDMLAEEFGPGSNGPLIVAFDVPSGGRALVEKATAALQRADDVAFVVPATFNAAGNAAVDIVIPRSAPQDQATLSLVSRLRHTVLPAALAGTAVHAYVGGETAASVDSAHDLGHRLPYVIGGVVILSFLLLMAVFRSVAVPVKAAVMNLLSIGAAYGVIVAVFQWGWLGGVIGIGKTGPIDPWVPLMLFTILFGLSMDYEVFLLSRIREEWLRTGDNATAVVDGLAVTTRVITAAAAIMVCVFGSFVIGDPVRVLKLFGLGLAAAIFVDATVVRMVLVPATMELLGGANWWLPRWLDRVVPTLTVESGESGGSGEPRQREPAGVSRAARYLL